MPLPFGDSPESVRAIHSFLELAALLCFAIMVVADVVVHYEPKNKHVNHMSKLTALVSLGAAIFIELLAYPYSRRNEAYSESELTQLTLQAADSNRAAAEANALARKSESELARLTLQAADSNRAAAEANALARKFESQIAEAHARSKEAEAQVVSAKAEAMRAGRQAAEASTKAEGFRLGIANAESKAVEASRQLLKLKTPRTLSADAKEKINNAARAFPGMRFDMYIDNNQESVNLMLALRNALTSGGWSLEKVNQSIVFGDKIGLLTISGLYLEIHKSKIDIYEKPLKIIGNILLESGIDVKLQASNHTGNDDIIHVIVGSKPLD